MMTDSIGKSASRGRVLAVIIMGVVASYLASRGVDLTQEQQQLGVEFIGAAVAVVCAMIPVVKSKMRSIKKEKVE